MNVSQSYELINTMTAEALGEESIVQEDWSNLVETGGALLDKIGTENFAKGASDIVGKTVFVDRVYSGSVPSIMKDDWTYGSILRKLSCDLPEAEKNEAWDLQHGQVYSQEIFYKPTINEQAWNIRVTWEVPMSFTDEQCRSAFKSPTELASFLTMIETAVMNSMTIKMDEVIMRTIDNMIAETAYDAYGSGSQAGAGGPRMVNLLYEYNNGPNAGGTALTFPECLYDVDWLKFAAYRIGVTVDRLARISTLFNLAGKARFTTAERLHVVLHSDFEKACAAYLQSGTFHKELVALPKHETVSYWQGSDTGYDVEDTTSIDCITSDNNTIAVEGILGVAFDDYAVAANCIDRHATSAYNAKGEFSNVWQKALLQCMNAKDENFVVFFAA